MDNLGVQGKIVDRVVTLLGMEEHQPPELRCQLTLVRVDPITLRETQRDTLIYYGRLNTTGTNSDRSGLRRIYSEGQWVTIDNQPVRPYDENGNSIPGFRMVLAGDFDNDQCDELVFTDTSDRLFWLDRAGLWFVSRISANARLIATSDFNGDGKKYLYRALLQIIQEMNLGIQISLIFGHTPTTANSSVGKVSEGWALVPHEESWRWAVLRRPPQAVNAVNRFL